MDILGSSLSTLVVGSAVVVAAVGFTYLIGILRPALLQGFRIVGNLFDMVAGYLQAGIGAIQRSMGDVKSHLTKEGHFSLVAVVIASALVLPLLLIVIVNEIRASTSFLEKSFPEDVDLLIGTATGGFIRALLITTAGLLVGFLVDAALGFLPFNWVAPHWSERAKSLVRRIALVAALCLLVVIMAIQLDIAKGGFKVQGEAVCLMNSAASYTPGVPSFEIEPDLVPEPEFIFSALSSQAVPITPSLNYAECLEEWNNDTSARNTFVGLAELSLILSAAFAWSLFTALGLGLLLFLAIVVVPLGFSLGLSRMLSVVVDASWFIVERLLTLLQWPGRMIIQLLHHLGMHLPPPDEDAANGNGHPRPGGGDNPPAGQVDDTAPRGTATPGHPSNLDDAATDRPGTPAGETGDAAGANGTTPRGYQPAPGGQVPPRPQPPEAPGFDEWGI